MVQPQPAAPVARLLVVAVTRVSYARRSTPMNGNEWKPEHTALMIQLNELGCSDHVIAGATGHDVDVVGRHRRDLGLRTIYRTAYSTLDALPAHVLQAITASCDRVAA